MVYTTRIRKYLRIIKVHFFEEARIGGGDCPFDAVVANEGEFVDGSAAFGGFDACNCGFLSDEVAAEYYDAVVFLY